MTFQKNNLIQFSINSINSKIFILYIYKTVLYKAVCKENVEIVKLLLTCEQIDINFPSIRNTI